MMTPEVDADGRPTDASLYALAMRTAKDLIVDIGLNVERLTGTDFVWTEKMRSKLVMVEDIEG